MPAGNVNAVVVAQPTTAAHAEYVSRTGVAQALEGNHRPLFTNRASGLKKDAATAYLRGPNQHNAALELVFSPAAADFLQRLGATPQEQERNIQAGVRAAMRALE